MILKVLFSAYLKRSPPPPPPHTHTHTGTHWYSEIGRPDIAVPVGIKVYNFD